MISWICFEWDMTSLQMQPSSVAPLIIRAAVHDEEKTVLKVIHTAFSMDSAWGDVSGSLQESMTHFTKSVFQKPEPACMVALHGNRIIGASLLDANPDAPNHLLTGPVILHEYRNRGLGSGLLAASLDFLHKKGFQKVRGVTRPSSIPSRFIYTKFSSTQSPFALDPLQTHAQQR
jgi:predicted N-acetyltransferase YhbS